MTISFPDFNFCMVCDDAYRSNNHKKIQLQWCTLHSVNVEMKQKTSKFGDFVLCISLTAHGWPVSNVWKSFDSSTEISIKARCSYFPGMLAQRVSFSSGLQSIYSNYSNTAKCFLANGNALRVRVWGQDRLLQRGRGPDSETRAQTQVSECTERGQGGYFALIFLIIPAQNPFFPSIFSAKYSPRTEACRDVPQVTRALRCVHVPTQECRHVPVKVAVDVLQQECHKVRMKNIHIHTSRFRYQCRL